MKRTLLRLAGLIAVFVAVTVTIGVVRNGGSGADNDIPGMFTMTRPAFASGLGQAQEAPAFPDPDIGLSAFVQLDSITLEDLDTLVRELFLDLKMAGDNFVIGEVIVDTNLGGQSLGVDVFLYADLDGHLVAYILDSQPGASAIQFFSSGQCQARRPSGSRQSLEQADFGSGFTALECAMGLASLLSGQEFPQSEAAIGWFHWGFPDATHIGAAAQGAGDNTPLNLYFALPSDAELKEASIAAVIFGSSSNFTLDGEALVAQNSPAGPKFVLPIEVRLTEINLAHTIRRSNDSQVSVGVVVVIKVP